MRPTHKDYPLLQELQKEELEWVIAGKWRGRWLTLWARLRGVY